MNNSFVFRCLACAAIVVLSSGCVRVIYQENVSSKDFTRSAFYGVIKDSLPVLFSPRDTLYVHQYVFCSYEKDGGIWSPLFPFNVREDSLMDIFSESLVSKSLFPLIVSDSLMSIENTQVICECLRVKKLRKRGNYAELVNKVHAGKMVLLPIVRFARISYDVQPFTSYGGSGDVWRGYECAFQLVLIRDGKELFLVDSSLGQQSKESFREAQLNQQDWDLLVEMAFKGLLERVEARKE
ncbi:MAG: hypothetical protein ACK500_07465 [Flavobacteriales bacterium]|jgi:hypothetical protein